ncbi:MAG TPA: hypothetical protein PK322_00230 [Opitutaceae bacterium]|nr:hypothetical protein [Opitutaceae bacterium]
MKTPTAEIRPLSVRDILRFFSPRWFIALMGTGALANILQVLAGGPSGGLHGAAVALLGLALAGFPVALALLGARWWIDRGLLLKEWAHSSLVQFYAAVFIAAAILVAGLVKIPLPALGAPDWPVALAKILWGFALVGSVATAVLVPWRIITLDHGEPRRLLGFWFLPPVGLFVVAFAGNFLALRLADPAWLRAMLAINTVLIGGAAVQAAILFALVLFRGLAYPFPAADVVPSFTIGLAPVGVSIIAVLSHLAVLKAVALPGLLALGTLAPVALAGALLLWGFGLWWLAVVALVVVRAARTKGIPFSLGYWAFVFPPAAYALATLLLAQAVGWAWLTTAGQILAGAVALGWMLVAALTLRGVFNRRVFALPPSFREILPATGTASGRIETHRLQDKYPVHSSRVAKRPGRSNAGELVAELKRRIAAHGTASHIGDFDHYTHTRGLGGEMAAGLVDARNVVFCFGPKIDDPKVLAVRPRAFGVAEYADHFVVSFLDAPAPAANEAMRQWVDDLHVEAARPS